MDKNWGSFSGLLTSFELGQFGKIGGKILPEGCIFVPSPKNKTMEAIQVGTQALGIKKMDTPGFTGEVRERMNALGGQLTHIDAKLTELIALLTGNAPDRVDKESPVKAPDGELNRIMMHLDGLSSVADQIVSKVDGLSRIL